MTKPSWRRVATAVLATGLLAPPGAATAQKVLVSFVPEFATDAVTELYDFQAGRVDWTRPGTLGVRGAVVTSDGRFAVSLSWQTATPGVRVIDMAHGSAFDVPVAFEPRIAHPRETAVFGVVDGPIAFGAMTRGTPARLDLHGLTTFSGCPAGTATAIDISGDGRRLFVLCESGDVAALDPDSGAVIRTLAVGAGVTIAANLDGSALVVARPGLGGAVDLVDATSGAVLQSTPSATFCAPSIVRASRDRTTLVVPCTEFGAPLPTSLSRVFDAGRWVWGATLDGVNLQIASVSPDNRIAFSTYVHRLGTLGWVQVNDLTSGAITYSVPVIASIAVSYAPSTPTASAIVSGRRVDLSWTLPLASPAVTGFVLEIGSAPGLTNLGTMAAGTQASLTVPAAPPGRYYVRVRAENVSGRSAPSNELVIDVP